MWTPRTMVQAVAVMALLRWMAQAQNNEECDPDISKPGGQNLGLRVFERSPGQALQWIYKYKSDIPGEVEAALSACSDTCKTETYNKDMKMSCKSFNFEPRNRNNSATCRWSEDSSMHANLVKDKFQHYFEKICLPKQLLRGCEDRIFVFDRFVKLMVDPKRYSNFRREEIQVKSRQECQSRCLEYRHNPFVCRSAMYNTRTHTCTLMDRIFKEELVYNGDYDYLENTCLQSDNRCPDKPYIILENKILKGHEIIDRVQANSKEDCLDKCLSSRKIYCRAYIYEDAQRTCTIIGDIDKSPTISARDKDTRLPVGRYNYYRVTCLNDSSSGQGGALFDRNTIGSTFFQRFEGHRLRNARNIVRTLEDLPRMSQRDCLSRCLNSEREHNIDCTSVEYNYMTSKCTLIQERGYSARNADLVAARDVDFYRMMDRINDVGVSGSGSSGSGGFYNNYPNRFPDRFTGGSGGFGSSGSGGFSGSGGGGIGFGGDSNYLGFGGSHRPCQEPGSFQLVGTGYRLRKQNIIAFSNEPNKAECEFKCQKEPGCRAFNFKPFGPGERNCELSDLAADPKDFFKFAKEANYDHYQCIFDPGFGHPDFGDLDVEQKCHDRNIEFILRTDEPFFGKLYTYGYSDRCFRDGKGKTMTVLQIPVGRRGLPECGTIQRSEGEFGNIVVVQFNKAVQTSQDRKYNLTCTIFGPRDTVVKSDQIVLAKGVPIPIYRLPAVNMLESRVRLEILHRGRPTDTVVVGDPLTFRITSLQYRDMVTDIFAYNVIAKDPITGRTVQLIDDYGCPLDIGIFPSLNRAREGTGVEARFRAFRIPEADFLVFEARVRSCKDGCDPILCESIGGRELPSFGRKKRDISNEEVEQETEPTEQEEQDDTVNAMFRVYTNPEDVPPEATNIVFHTDGVCITKSEYYCLIAASLTFFVFFVAVGMAAGILYKRWKAVSSKLCGISSSSSSGISSSLNSTPFPTVYSNNTYAPSAPLPRKKKTPLDKVFNLGRCPSKWEPDPSEPIYTEPSLFENDKNTETSKKMEDKGSANPGYDSL